MGSEAVTAPTPSAPSLSDEELNQLETLIAGVNEASDAHGESVWYGEGPGEADKAIIMIDRRGIGKSDFDYIVFLTPERVSRILRSLRAGQRTEVWQQVYEQGRLDERRTWAGADPQSTAEVARLDAVGASEAGRDGTDEHLQHRAWESSPDRAILEIHRRGAGLQSDGQVRASVGAGQSEPVATAFVAEYCSDDKGEVSGECWNTAHMQWRAGFLATLKAGDRLALFVEGAPAPIPLATARDGIGGTGQSPIAPDSADPVESSGERRQLEIAVRDALLAQLAASGSDEQRSTESTEPDRAPSGTRTAK